MTEADWRVVLKGPSGKKEVRAPFVFLGAGGGALPLLQRSGIPEAADFAGFPVSGLWLVCGDAQLADRQRAKVYGKAAVGAPPMSVPHLDTRWDRWQNARCCSVPLPASAASFLKQGSLLDLPASVRATNLLPMLQVGATNFELVQYLINQLRQSPAERHEALQQFMPTARAEDWTLSVAGQRVQIIKRSKQGGTAAAGNRGGGFPAMASLAALLGGPLRERAQR